MSVAHNQYPGLIVYQGEAGEQPHPGAFYVPKAGDTISKIALRAYGDKDKPMIMASIINRSEYNLKQAKAGKLRYRVDSNRCDSQTIKKAFPAEFSKFGYDFVHTFKNGVTRPLGLDKAWIALCPTSLNNYGSSFPAIWIPTYDSKEPDEVHNPVEPEKLPGVPRIKLPNVKILQPIRPSIPTTPDAFVPGGGGTSGGDQPSGGKTGFKKSRIPSWLGWVVLAGLGGTVVYWYRTAKS